MEKEGFKPGEEQQEALLMALTQPLSIVTGGPGTGKTAMVRLLTLILKERGEKILLAAPTGRAARRLSEVCKMPAKTLHRLLALRAQDDELPDASFWLTAEPLDCDTLIVDECSMIDLFLFANLLSAVKPGTRLLLIGDADQLPSIGPGQVLRDLLQTQAAAHKQLTEIYRQEAHKLIVSNAHRILKGDPLEFDQTLESDFIFIDCDDEEAMHEGVMKLCRQVLPGYYGVTGLNGVQVLSAIRRGPAGVSRLNRSLQELAHTGSFQVLEAGGHPFARGDKVMQTSNNYDKGVFNGELGQILFIDNETRKFTVQFDVGVVLYEQHEADQLLLAYAVTVHKSQGSEFAAVIIPVLTQHYVMLQRNLLYTGMTRAKQLLILVGSRRALGIAIRNNTPMLRQTRLTQRLTGPTP